MNIDELITENFVQDGTFKIRKSSWYGKSYFLPYFKDEDDWYGLDGAGQYLRYGAKGPGWEMFKPKNTTYEAWFDADSIHRPVCMFPVGTTMGDGWVKF